MKQNILVFPCGSEVGLEIYRSLNLSTHFNVIGGSSIDDHGKFVYSDYIGGLPMVSDEDFTERINEVVDKYKINYIFPAHDSVVLKLAQEKAIGNLKCELVASPLTTCEISRSKQKTYQIFKDIIPTPKVYADASTLKPDDFPVFLKPDIGQGSKGTHLAMNLEDVKFYTGKDLSLLLIEFLPGKEYTIDCFTDKNGNLLFSEGRERKRISGGISVNSIVVKDDRFKSLAEKINQTLSFRGVWFFQVKEDSNKQLVLMEISTRIAGTMALTRARGVNLALLSLFELIGYDVEPIQNDYNIIIDRALQNIYLHNIKYSHVYLDLDDTVIYDGKVNPYIMAYIYQCLNERIRLHLLTKHKEDLNVTLKKYRLNNIFDEIICIKDKSEKPRHIQEGDAIFIDDSFAERKRVKETCKIPVFDSHMIEALMEKF